MTTSFSEGKEEALEDLISLWEDGADVTDCIKIASEALSNELDKQASEEDVRYRLGVEAVCYSFLKEAADVYGEYDVADVDGNELLGDILEGLADAELEKIAEGELVKAEEPSRKDRVKAHLSRNKGRYAAGAATAGTVAAGLGVNKALGKGGREALRYSLSRGENSPGVQDRVKAIYHSSDLGKRLSKAAYDEGVQDALAYLESEGLLDD